jgi:hypothetical protein
VVFEGRDTAGKGGVISRITARTSPRVYRHVALPAPSDREDLPKIPKAQPRPKDATEGLGAGKPIPNQY